MPRTIFSPTTTPIDPPMKLYSIEAMTVVVPSSLPMPTITASSWPVAWMVFASRSRYGLVSVNVSGSFERRLGRELIPAFVIEQRLQPIDRPDPEVMAALVADLEVLERSLA